MMPHQPPTDGKPILVFPGGMPRSLEYLQRCLRDRQAVIGASSLSYDVSRENYPRWLHLPYITQPGFNDALKTAIERFDIGGVYTPNPVVWSYLKTALSEIAPSVPLVNPPPIDAELSGYRKARQHAHALLERPFALASDIAARRAMSEIELSALFRHTDLIPGMCDHAKLCALCEIARYTPPGDVVEIGTWWGKSAFVLSRLAHCYDLGSVLCVDPWSNEHLIQDDGKSLVDSVSAEADADEAFVVFQMNLLPYSAGRLNYLRLPSTEGARHYRDNAHAASPEFGSTTYGGRIALLHIDGNHSYDAASADLRSWTGMVVGGGWIVVDDYTWPFGDGPRRAADELLAEKGGEIDVAFVTGGALFLQLAGSKR
jgi:cephalosporin hydroxylase